MTERDTFLTVRQLQDLLQVDRITVYRMLRDGRLQGFKVGRQWRFSRQAIESWLNEHRASLELAGPLPANGDVASLSSQILHLPCIQAIQSIFAEAVKVAVVTTSLDGTPLAGISNSCDFCNLILSTRTGEQRCASSWQAAADGSRLAGIPGEGQAPPIATCHAGLRYVWGLVEVQGHLVAAIHAGQFRDGPANGNGAAEALSELSDATGLRLNQLQDTLAGVPLLDEDRPGCLLRCQVYGVSSGRLPSCLRPACRTASSSRASCPL